MSVGMPAPALRSPQSAPVARGGPRRRRSSVGSHRASHAGCYQSCPGEPWQRESPAFAGLSSCAEEDSNLHPGIPGQGPQPCASTNSATGAGGTARAQRPLAVAEYSSARGCGRLSGGGRRGGARGTRRGRADDQRGEHAARAERRHRDGGGGGVDHAPATALPAAMPIAIPVEVHVKASVIVPVGARSSSIPLAETNVGAIEAPATSRIRPSTAGSPETPTAAWPGPRPRARSPGAAAGRRRRRGGRWRARRTSSRRPTARAGRR